mmetsp:Transcript_22186/g.18945  ORF Transcript_22186/g.18945 Transcript_22186/m.18945 type:complete len:95 (+) Transcript_22186:115-399(+)
MIYIEDCDEHQNNMNQRWYWENNRIYSPSRPVTSFRAHAVKVDENSEETLCIVGPEANGKQLEVPNISHSPYDESYAFDQVRDLGSQRPTRNGP